MPSTELTQVAELFIDARQALKMERQRVNDEIRAFKQFIERVEAIRPHSVSNEQRPPLRTRTMTPPDSTARVQAAYEDTVMAVSHYEQEYGETYAESLREELTPEVATVLTQQSVFDRACKQATVTAAREATHKRQLLRESLKTEREAIETGKNALVPIADQLVEYRTVTPTGVADATLDGYLRRLDVLEERCQELIDQRQDIRVAQRNRLRLSSPCTDIA
ncbi:MAG: hypothetical protein ACLFR6_00415 [Salinarchaeum sp.]